MRNNNKLQFISSFFVECFEGSSCVYVNTGIYANICMYIIQINVLYIPGLFRADRGLTSY